MLKIGKRGMFFIGMLAFLLEMGYGSIYDSVSNLSIVFDILITSVFLVYAVSYLLWEGRPKLYKLERYFPYFFAAIIVLLFMHYLLIVVYLKVGIFPIMAEPYAFLRTVPLFLPSLLLIFFGMSLYRAKPAKGHERGIKMLSLLFFVIAISLIAAVFLSGYLLQAPQLDDEEFITLAAAHALVNGSNPYTISFPTALYNYPQQTNKAASLTFTTNNTFEAGIDYPALSFLTTVPFVLITKLGILVFNYSGVMVQYTLFILIMYFLMALMMKDEALAKPPIAIIVFTMLVFTFLTGFLNFLMLSLMIYSFYKIESKYLWVILGIAAALQEELWFAIILFLLYSFRNHGLRKGTINLFGVALVFLLVNGYFILAGPHSFITNVLVPIGGYILPSPYATFGYPIAHLYQVMLSSGNIPFYAASVATIIAFLYFNEKRLIFLMPIIPLLFLFRSNPPYYYFFMAALVISMYIKGQKASAQLPHKSLYRYAAIGIISFLAVLVAAFMISSHNQAKSFGINVYDQRIIHTSNGIVYNATLSYSPNHLGQLSVIEYVVYKNYYIPIIQGIGTGRILIGPNAVASNSSFSYVVNPNRIYLNGSGGLLNISILVPSNESFQPYIARCVLYNNAYYYTCPDARING